jgi:hypothetical protein
MDDLQDFLFAKKRTKDVNYFVALSVPARFGDSEAASTGLNLQIGFTFN